MVRAGRHVARPYGGPLEGLRRVRQRAFFVRVRDHGRKSPFGDRRAEGKLVGAMTGPGSARSQVSKSGKMFPVPCVWRSSCRCARFGAPWLDRIAAAGARSRGWASPKRRFCASSWKTNGRAPESPAEGAVGALGARRTPPQLTRPMLPMGVGSPCAGGPKRKRCRGGTVDHSGVGDEGCRPRGARPPAAGPPGPCALRWEMLAHLLSSAPPTGVRIPVQGARNENGAGAAPLTISGVGDEGFEPPALCV